MDPTTKEGREALVSGLRRMSCPPERRCGPQSKRLQVPCDCLVTEGAAAALSRIEKLEAERAVFERTLIDSGESIRLIRAALEDVKRERDALRADLERAREALRPFAAAADDLDDDHKDQRDIWESGAAQGITAGDLRRAKAVLSPVPAPVETPPTVGTIVMSPTDFEKFKRAIDPSPESYEPRKRPKGSNADEWQLFLVEHANASAFLAVQIAEAIDDASKGARA